VDLKHHDNCSSQCCVADSTLHRNEMDASMRRGILLVAALLACISCSVYAEGASLLPLGLRSVYLLPVPVDLWRLTRLTNVA
jgi:hypothetical protein